jgi:hypothetical protein
VPVTETKTEEVAFGDPITKTFTSIRKMFLVTAGKSPIVNETAYTPEQISTLEVSYKDYLANIEKEAKSDAQSGASVSLSSPAKTSSLNRLL